MYTRVIAAALIGLLLQGCQVSRSLAPPAEADLAALADYNKRYLKAINDGDSAALSQLTAEEHVMFPPNRPPVTGKAANDAANRRAFESTRIEEHWYPVETHIGGDWAFERGTYTVAASPKAGGDTRKMSGNYLRIFRRQPDGTWKMIRDMFNSDRPN